MVNHVVPYTFYKHKGGMHVCFSAIGPLETGERGNSVLLKLYFFKFIATEHVVLSFYHMHAMSNDSWLG